MAGCGARSSSDQERKDARAPCHALDETGLYLNTYKMLLSELLSLPASRNRASLQAFLGAVDISDMPSMLAAQSSGCTATATSPNIVSRRVVAFDEHQVHTCTSDTCNQFTTTESLWHGQKSGHAMFTLAITSL
eukprot:1053956-Amphidinium_carterae.1